MKRINLIALIVLLSNQILFAKTASEIIQEKISEIVSLIHHHKNQGKIRKIAVLGFYPSSKQKREKKIGLVFSRFLNELLISEGDYKVADQEKLSKIIQKSKLNTISDFTADQLKELEDKIHSDLQVLGEVKILENQIMIKVMLYSSGMKTGEMKSFFSKNVSLDMANAYRMDKRGDLYQESFDLQKRFFIGPKWSPAFYGNQKENIGVFAFQFGYYGASFNIVNTSKQRYKVINGEITLNPLSFDILSFEYDLTRLRVKPLLWVTTFFGKPRRYDFSPDGGFAIRLAKIEYHPYMSEKFANVEWLSVLYPFYIWTSPDMLNYLRFRIGPGYGMQILKENEKTALKHYLFPKIMVEGKFVIDKKGWHSLGAVLDLNYQYSLYKKSSQYWVIRANVSYEYIFMRISEQPISIFFRLGGSYRDDIVDVSAKSEMRASMGLNFSFDSPPLVPLMNELQLRKESVLKLND